MRTKLILFSSILVLALALSACGPSTGSGNTLNVTGTGTIYITPDIAYVNIGVHTENTDIAQAVASNNIQAQAVIDALRNSGVEAAITSTTSWVEPTSSMMLISAVALTSSLTLARWKTLKPFSSARTV